MKLAMSKAPKKKVAKKKVAKKKNGTGSVGGAINAIKRRKAYLDSL